MIRLLNHFALPPTALRSFLCLLAIFAVGSSQCLADRKPDVVLIYTDDLGPGDLGCFGGTIAPTPHIDRLAAEGALFSRYYSASPICSASRAALITGQFPARHRISSYLQTKKGNRACGQADFLDPAAPSLPRVFQKAGYATAHFGKWHLGGGRDVDDAPKFAAYGYDENAGTWEGPEPHPDLTATDWIWSPKDKVKRWERTGFFVDKTLDFLRRHPDQPCFINLWPDDPHTPWVPSAEATKGDSPENLRGVMAELDRQVGRLLDGLQSLGREKNCIVIFTSDNGPSPTFDQSRTTGWRGSKWSLYEGGVRVPFLIRWPGRIPAGHKDDQSTLCSVDLFPSLLSLAGLKLPPDYQTDGMDASAALLGKPFVREKPLYWEYGRNEATFLYPKGPDKSLPLAIQDGSWKLLMTADGTQTELYDLSSDPTEKTDLSEKEPATRDRLRSLLQKWCQSWPLDVASKSLPQPNP
jgi:arylsulfatase A-like enzyme